MSSTKTTAQKLAEQKERLKKLHLARNEARTQNHHEVVKEDERSKLPTNFEARQRQADWLINDKKLRDAAAEKNLEYDRIKMLNVSAAEADRLDKMRKRKKNPDAGFSDYESRTARQYKRLVKEMPVNLEKYEDQKGELGETFYHGVNPILEGSHKDSPKAIDKMVKDVEDQIQKRKKFSRRRTHNDEADIDYINEKNARFNKKLERFYGEHTAEIKQNLERGTAI